MDYIVAIPSYKREYLIVTHTLHTLIDKQINSDKIYIFVADKDEFDIYTDNVPPQYYKEIIIGMKGLREQRNFITDYFPENTHIVQFDDDVKDILKLIPGKTKSGNRLVSIEKLDDFITDAFELLKKTQGHLWGVYPVNNAFFMSDKITTDLRFIVGPMWGIINRKAEELKLELNEKEDFERTLRHYHKDGTVSRFNNVTINTRYYKTSGGLQAENICRYQEAEKSADFLITEFPHYCTKWYKGKTLKRAELRLKDKKKI